MQKALKIKFREIKKKDIPAVWKLLEQLKPLSEIKSEDFTPDIDDAWTEFNSILRGMIIIFIRNKYCN